jgi:FkbM family methyltransferase
MLKIIEAIDSIYSKLIRSPFDTKDKMSKDMRRLRLAFAAWVNTAMRMAQEWGIGKLVISLEGDGLFVREESGLYFLYVPNFGLRHLEFNGTNDRLQLEFILNNLGDNCVFFDVGASYGYYGMSLAKAVPSSAVHCFEAVPSTCYYLIKNIEKNGLKNIIVQQEAVGEIEGKVYVTNNNFGGDYISVDIGSKGGIHHNEVQCITLDSYVKANEIHRVDYIKIDVEGAELLVLKGARNLIEVFKPIIQVETTDAFMQRFGHKSADVFKFLMQMGYDYLFLGKHEEEYGIGKLQLSTGDIYSDMAVASEFFFHPRSSPVKWLYVSKYNKPLRYPYV